MVGPNYQPKMKAEIVAVKGVTTIKASGPFLGSLAAHLSRSDLDILESSVISQAICPSLYWFKYTPAIRRILKVESDCAV